MRSTLHHKQFGSLSQTKLLLEKTLQLQSTRAVYILLKCAITTALFGKDGYDSMSMYDFAACENIIDILYYNIDVVTSIKTKFDRS